MLNGGNGMLDIGKRINQLRKKNDLTLDELASRCELTKGFLSQLERNLTSPSLQTLEDITNALGVSMSRFFTEDEDEQVVFTKDDAFIDEQEGRTLHWIVPNAQKNAMEPIIIDLQEGASSHVMAIHKGEEFGYVLQGTIQLMINNHSNYSVKKGECFYVKGNEEYYLKNDGKRNARVLWISTPPAF